MRRFITTPAGDFPVLLHPPLGDHAAAASYWADKEYKTWAVDVIARVVRDTRYGFTMYVRARSEVAASACARKNLYRPVPAGARFVARLAGPLELGCVPTFRQELLAKYDAVELQV